MFQHPENESQMTEGLQYEENIKNQIMDIPEWAMQVRAAMPDWGFEIHCLRWLDGLDVILRSIKEQTYIPSYFGTYGDNPGKLFHGIAIRSLAVKDWIDGVVTTRLEIGNRVNEWLGEHEPDKLVAAQCFVEITEAYLKNPYSEDEILALGETWRNQIGENKILERIFNGEGLDRGLFSGSSYWALSRLDLILRIIGGDLTNREDILGSCNYELRSVLQEDPLRIQITRGYIWGVYAYLKNKNEEWLLREKPDVSGSAIHSLHSFLNSSAPADLVSWLAVAFMLTMRFWYLRALIFAAQKASVPDHYWDVPSFS